MGNYTLRIGYPFAGQYNMTASAGSYGLTGRDVQFFYEGEAEDPVEPLSTSYVVDGELTFIAWDAPTIVYPGIDVDYKLTGYDWFNRTLTWSLDTAPGWLSIGSSSGILTGTPPDDSTNHSIVVRLTPGTGTPVTKSFTLQVDSAKCKHVAKTGSDSNSGTAASPYLTIGKAMDVVSASPTGWTVYVHDGAYSETWANKINWWGNDFTEQNPLTLRNYPGDSFTITNVAASLGTFQDYVVYYGFAIVGGSEWENGCLVVNFNNIAKLIDASGYRTSDQDRNPTGIYTAYNAILDSCTSYDNHAVSGGYNQNNSNYLHYCDKANSGMQAFYIDCIGMGQSVINFKLKHSGEDRVHYHRCVAYGSPNGFDTQSDWSTVRFCLSEANTSFAEGNRACINYGGSSGDFTGNGMLFDGNLSIAESEECAFDMGFGNSHTASNCPIWRANTAVCTGTASTSYPGLNFAFRRQSYGNAVASPPVRKLIDNVVYSPSSSQVQLNATDVYTVLTTAQVNSQSECSGNTHAGAIGATELDFQAAGYNWSYTAAGGLVQGSAL